MRDQETGMPHSVRNFEKRSNRHRQLYWRALIPIAVVVGGGYALGRFQDALLLSVLGVMVVMLIMLREIIDVLGYLGGVQRKAAEDRDAIRRELVDLRKHLESSTTKS